MQAGDSVTLEVDDWTGDVNVTSPTPHADAIEGALAGNCDLTAAIRQLGHIDGRFDGSPFQSKSTLLAEVGDAEPAALQWM
jgi:hypothetical protein